MKRAISSFFGILLLITSITGMAISIFGISSLWRLEAKIETSLNETLTLLDTALQTTSNGLHLANQSLNQADQALLSVGNALTTASNSIEQTRPLIDNLTEISTRELPQTIAQSQQAIQSAQTSAKIIDSTLSALASIPLIGLRGYDNTRPLSGSLAELSKSLEPISDSLASMEEPLATAKENLKTMSKSIGAIANDIAELRASLNQSRQVITDYESVAANLTQQVVSARLNAPAALKQITWLITIVLIWLGLTQIGLLLQSLALLGVEINPARQAKPDSV